jgi:hypothetical protein
LATWWIDGAGAGACALRAVLAGYPRSGGLTDDWAHLAEALEGVRAFAAGDLVGDEPDRLERSIAECGHNVYDR